MFLIVCEGSVVYQFSSSDRFKQSKKLDFFLEKKINHVSSTASYGYFLFASLYNENKEDDKIYKMKEENFEEIKINEIIGEQRIMDIFSGGSCSFVLLGFKFHLYF